MMYNIYVKVLNLFCFFDQILFSARLLQIHSIVKSGIVVSAGKFGTLIGFDAHQDDEVKIISKEQVVY